MRRAIYHLKPLQYWSVYGYHSILLVTLFTAALIRFDGEQVPRPGFLPALLAGLAASPVFVWLHPVPVCHVVAAPDWFVGMSAALVGFAGRCRTGFCVWPATRRLSRCRPAEQPELWATALCGVFLGWQAVVTIVLTAAVTYVTAVTVTRFFPWLGTGPWCGYLTVAGLLYIIKWGHLVEQFPSLGPHGNVGVLCVLALAACGVSLVTEQLMRSQHLAALSQRDREMS